MGFQVGTRVGRAIVRQGDAGMEYSRATVTYLWLMIAIGLRIIISKSYMAKLPGAV